MPNKTTFFFLIFLMLGGISPSRAEENRAMAAAQANNPLADITAFNLHNYYIGELTGSDSDTNQFFFRYAKPFSLGEFNWLTRATLPVNSFPVGTSGDKETGIGDFNILAAYQFGMSNPAVSFGIGPL